MGTTLKDWLLDPRIQQVLMVAVGSVIVIVVFRLFAGYLSSRVHDTDTRYRTRKIFSALQYLTVLFVAAVVFKDQLGGLTFAFLWDELEVPITLDSDLAQARTIIEETLQQTVGDFAAGAENAWKQMVKKYRIEDARVRPLVTMGFNENWAAFTARYSVDFQRRRITKDLISTEILDRIRASEGRVSIAFSTLAITDFPRLTVETGNSGSNPSDTPCNRPDTRS